MIKRRSEGLASLARIGIGWSSLGILVQGIGQIAVLAVLGRILTPEEFGIANAALLIFALGANLFEGGVGLNIAQRRSLSSLDISSAAQVSLFLSIVFSGTVFFGKDIVADFFGAPELRSALFIITITLLCGGIVGPQEAVLFHQRRYKTITVIKISSFLIGYSLVTIVLALNGLNYEALLYGHLAAYLISGTLFFAIVGMPVLKHFNKRCFIEHLTSTGLFTFSRIATYVSNQADKIIIGRILGPGALGIYGRAHQIMMIPNKVFMQGVTRVVTPLFSSIQEERARVGSAYLKAVRMSFALLAPVSTLFVLFSTPIVRLLLGPGWEAVADILAILGIAGFFHVLYKVPLTVLYSQKMAGNSSVTQTVFAVVLVGCVLLVASRGMSAVAVTVTVLTALNYILLTLQVVFRLSLPIGDVVWAHFRGLLPAVAFLLLGFTILQLSLFSSHWLLPLVAAVFALFSVLAASSWNLFRR